MRRDRPGGSTSRQTTGGVLTANPHETVHLETEPIPEQDTLRELPVRNGGHPSLLFLPATYNSAQPAPLALLLHGVGGTPGDGIALLREYASRSGFLLLAVGSRAQTWDLMRGRYGPDVEAIDASLRFVLAHHFIDPDHLAIGGFSDGASYALSLGLINGRFFTHVIAFSPGFMAPTRSPDSPRIYISHGIRDPVLPIGACSRRLVPLLQDAGFAVHYHEFSGEHTIPLEIREEAVNWFLG